MKIVIEAQHAIEPKQPRGIGVYSIQLIRALLHRNKHDYSLTSFDFRGENENCLRARQYFGEYNVPFHECTDLDYRIAIREEYVYENRSYNYYTGAEGDIFHFMNFNTIPTNLSGKMLVTIHDLNWIGYEEGTSSIVLPLLYKSFDRVKRMQPHIIAVSNSARDEILQYSDIPKEKIHVVYQAYEEDYLFVEKDRKKISSILSDNYDYLFYVGAFERKKNIVRIVKAFEQIAEKFKELRLVLAGKPSWDDSSSIYQAINDSPFKNRIITPGYIDTDTKRLLYSNALGLVFPSICEGFGIPVLEAMVCGCPVITADNTSLPEAGGNAAIYVNALDTEQLAFEMERVVSSETLRKELQDKGFQQVKKFSWIKTAENIEEIYELIKED
jgi:glycosyltransferase involved in cell wall biosynthesis